MGRAKLQSYPGVHEEEVAEARGVHHIGPRAEYLFSRCQSPQRCQQGNIHHKENTLLGVPTATTEPDAKGMVNLERATDATYL